MSHSPDLNEAYEPPESLWHFIKSVANERELDVIKSQIGESLVETSIDLHNEVDTLLEIWRDYRHETQLTLNQVKQNSSQKIFEPPHIRDTLKKEICLFVKQMREQYNNDDQKFCKQIASNNHNLNVINYVLNTSNSSLNLVTDRDLSSRTSQRPRTALNKQTGTETPCLTGRESRQKIRYTPRSRSKSITVMPCSPTTTPIQLNRPFDENLELLVDEEKINSMEIDQIVENLRDLLQTECDTLMSDIEFLYECIDKESEYRLDTKRNLNEPSLNELKEERKRLESDLLTSTGKNQVQISKLPSNVSANNSNRSIRSPLLTNRATPSPPTSASSVRSEKTIEKRTPSTTRTTTSLKPVVPPKRSTSVSKPTVDVVQRVKTKLDSGGLLPRKLNANQLFNSTGSSNTDLKPMLSRTSSAASSIDSMSLSVNSHASSKASAVQKFRQMVLESRD